MGRGFPGRLRETLSVKLCIFFGLAVFVSVVIFAFYSLYYEAKDLEKNAKKEVMDLSGIVIRNTRRSTQNNHPEGIEDIIKTAGEQKNVLSVRIYTRAGTVRYASDPGSIGFLLGKDSPSCKKGTVLTVTFPDGSA